MTATIRALSVVAAVLFPVMSAACISRTPGPQRWSVIVETSEVKLDGTMYDYSADVSIGLPLPGTPIIGGPEFSKYPDLAAFVISENTVETDNEDVEPVATGPFSSPCENRVACVFDLDIPAGYFMIVVLDVDVKWHDWVDGVIFADRTRGPINDERVAALEERAREWMDGVVENVPSGPIAVLRRRDCRKARCEPDGLTGTAAISVTPLRVAPESLLAESATASADNVPTRTKD